MFADAIILLANSALILQKSINIGTVTAFALSRISHRSFEC